MGDSVCTVVGTAASFKGSAGREPAVTAADALEPMTSRATL